MKYLSKHKISLRLALSIALVFSYCSSPLLAQGITTNASTEKLESATLNNLIQYALANQPVIKQALIDEKITESQIKSRLADWYPQINFNYNYQHNFIVPTSIIAGNPVKLGVKNVSATQLTLSQQIFNRDLLLANRTKTDVMLQARQNTQNNKINIAVDVSKAYYDVLATTEQINVAKEDIIRLEKSLKDATNQYNAGISDKIDFKRATISLNNTKANKKSNEEILKAKIQYLKSLIGYPNEADLAIVYEQQLMEQEIFLDTLQTPDYFGRIELQLLETQRKLAEANLTYNKWSYLPNISLNGAYNLNFQNNQFSDLYARNYPQSFGLLTFSLPIFQGGKRKANINTAQWEVQRANLEIENLKNNINSEYATALAGYQSNLTNLKAQTENVDLAKEVYDIIQLQYRAGIKAYLEVVTAETDLSVARINYYNALYQVLASKIDVQKSLGQLNY